LIRQYCLTPPLKGTSGNRGTSAFESTTDRTRRREKQKVMVEDGHAQHTNNTKRERKKETEQTDKNKEKEMKETKEKKITRTYFIHSAPL
jgi:hypothetical protein